MKLHSYAYLGTREIVEAFSPFNIFLCIQYCVVGNASLEVRAMALKRVAHTRGNNVCFRYGDRTLVRPFLMPLGSFRASKHFAPLSSMCVENYVFFLTLV